PDDPRDGVVRSGERDVRLDARAGRVDIERGITGVGWEWTARVQPIDADLLPAESVHVDAAHRLRPDRARGARNGLLHGLRHEDLPQRRAVIGDAVVLLPGDPRNRIVPGYVGAVRNLWVSCRPHRVNV